MNLLLNKIKVILAITMFSFIYSYSTTDSVVSNDQPARDSIQMTSKAASKDTTIDKAGLISVVQDISPGEWISKKRILSGLNASFNQAKMEDLHWNLILAELGDFSGHIVEASGYVGYFFWDAIAVGLRAGYNRIEFDVSYNLTGEEEKRIQSLDNKILGEIFLRNYIRIGDSYSFYFFNETSIRMSGGKGVLQETRVDAIEKTLSKTISLQAGVRPGLAVMLYKGFAFETSVSLLGFTTTYIDSESNGVKNSSIVLNSLDFDINLLKINFGMNWYI